MTLDELYPEGRIVLREVALRDGLQMVSRFPSTAGKKRWIEAEYAAGVRYFDLGSFLPAAHHPQFADIRELVALAASLPGAVGSALILNKRGAHDALDSGVPQIDGVVSATEAHSERNVRRSRAQAIQEIADLCRMRDGSAHRPVVSAGVAMAFGCSITGPVDPNEVYHLIEALLEAGVDLVSVADTVGYAGPDQVAAMVERVVAMAGGRPVGIHLHDTRGLGLANAAAALGAGATVFDGALGGLGGCPAAPKATGNIVFEDLVFLCQTKGIDTGIDLERLVAIRAIQAEEMPDETTYGAIAKAGLPIGHRPAGAPS
jgi:hydroxymethylglutaryl-CoA lyase